MAEREKIPTHAVWKNQFEPPNHVVFTAQCGDKVLDGRLVSAFDFLALYQLDTQDLDRPLCEGCLKVLLGNRGKVKQTTGEGVDGQLAD